MRAIVFDFDGTLIDCKERQSLLAASLCQASGFNLDVEAFWSSKRDGATTGSAICAQGVEKSISSYISKLWVDQIESDTWLRMDRLFPEVMRSLRDARDQGFRLHLLTARSNNSALIRQLRWLSIDGFFDHVEIVRPEKASQLKANYLAAVSPIIFIGDTESDASAATAAQIRFMAVTTGQRSADYLQGQVKIESSHIKTNLRCAIRDGINELE